MLQNQISPRGLKILCGIGAAIFCTVSVVSVSAPANAAFEWRPPQDVVGTMQVLDEGSVLVDPSYAPPSAAPVAPVNRQLAPIAPPINTNYNAPVPVDLSDIPADAFLNTAPQAQAAPVYTPPAYTPPVMPAPIASPSMTSPSMAPLPSQLDNQGRAAGLAGGSGGTVSRSTTSDPLSLAPSDFATAPSLPPVTTAVAPQANISSAVSSATPSSQVTQSGSAVPLAIAMRQVVPNDYEFSYGEGVDLGALVDWSSGRPWAETVERMVQPLGLSATIQGNIISLSRTDGARVASGASSVARPSVDSTFPAYDSTSSEFGAPQSLSGAAISQGSVTHSLGTQTLNTEGDNAMAVAEMQAVPPQSAENEVAAGVIARRQNNNMLTGDTRAIPAGELKPVVFQTPNRALDQEMVWYGTNGSMLSDVIKRWAQRAGVEMNWESEHDFPLRATVVITGTFQDAVRQILEGFDQADPRPIARLFKNTADGPSVLVVEEQFLIR